MATSSDETVPHSVLRPHGSDPLASNRPSVHLRNQETRGTAGLRPNKAPLPPGSTSVYSRGSLNRDLRVTERAKSSSVPNGSRTDSIKSNDLRVLPVIREDQNTSSVRRYSRISIRSDGFDWLDDDESTVFKDDENSKALEICQNSILKPYYVILKLIGWRQLFQYDEIHDFCIKKVINAIFAVLVIVTTLTGFVFQEILCFRRAQVFNEEIKTPNGSSFIFLRCDEGFVRFKGVGNLLVLISYVFGYYIFRYSQREHLSNLTEKVFLGYTDKFGQFSQKKLIRYLKFLGLIGIVWFLLSVPLNILRIYSLKLLSKDTYYYYLSPHSKEELIDMYNQSTSPSQDFEARRYIYIIISVIGFTVNDLFYTAAIINYALQCQLITFLINITVERICRNCWKVDHAIKEIKVTQDFLKVLNGQVASQMSVLLYVLIQTFVHATRNWLKTDGDNRLAVMTGLLNTMSWLFLAMIIIAQATWVTITCQKIRNLGMDLRTRPYTYLETSQLDLDSLVLYTTSITVDDDSTEILQTCKRTILKPYFTVLKLIGWRRFSLRNNSIYMRKFLNIFLPLLILTLWMIGFSAQLVLCFDRRVVLGSEVRFNGTKFLYYRCDGKYFLRAFIPVLLVVASYIYGVYIFRYVQIEHLSSLTEKVYLGYTDKDGPFSQKRLLASFRILVLVGILWLMWSFPLNILRVVSLKFTSEDTYFYFLTSYSVNDLKELYRQNNTIPHPVSLQYRYILIVLSVLGFTLNDLFYIAAVLNYALQCQLIYFLVNVTVERISNSCWKVDHAIKEIKVTQDFLKVLNGGLATQMSLVLFIVLQAFVLATLNFLKTCDYSEFNWSIEQITGILNITSWLFLIAFITIPAMRLTNACQRIHKLGIELRTRPFMYSKISKLDLDSFLLYTSKITLNARLVEIPMKPIFVIPVLFTIAVIWGLLTFY